VLSYRRVLQNNYGQLKDIDLKGSKLLDLLFQEDVIDDRQRQLIMAKDILSRKQRNSYVSYTNCKDSIWPSAKPISIFMLTFDSKSYNVRNRGI
jgi:hypothetical protein